jgi:hypothetical protein
MPQYFKALATIMAWAMWIGSWVTFIGILTGSITSGCLFGSEPPPMVVPVFFAVGLAEGIGAVVVMVLRKKME